MKDLLPIKRNWYRNPNLCTFQKNVKYYIAFCITFLLLNLNLSAQTDSHLLQGVIVNSVNDPISGATLKTSNGITTVSDIKGNFRIELPSSNSSITITHVSYDTKVINVKGEKFLQIVLESNENTLDEVVVVGYGTQKKSNVTGAISSVNVKELENKPVINVVEALQGTTPGLTIQQSTSQPGSRPAINVRGINTLNNNDPMVIIDGIIGDVQNVNMSDIENISILKDASSAAIYGSRAANGVILITTKRGNKDSSTIRYNFNLASQTPTFLPNIVEPWVYAEMRNEALFNSGRPVQFSAGQIMDFKQNYPNTNWMKEIYKEKSPQSAHDLSILGGNNKTTYLISGAYTQQESMMQGPDYGLDRANFRSNVETEVSDRFKINLLASYARNTIKDHAYWTEWIIEQATRMPSIYPIVNPDGSYNYPSGSNSNSLARLEKGGLRSTANDDLSGIVNAEFKILDGLTLKGMLGSQLYYNRLKENRSAIPGSGDSENRSTNSFQKIQNITSNLLLNYAKSWENHTLSALGGFSYEGGTDNRFETFRIKDSDDFDIMGGLQTTNTGNQEWQSEWSIYSFLMRVNYDFANKYMFEFNIRDDISSKFRKGNRSAWFPSMSAGWRISEEKFYAEGLKNILPSLKLRSSWGLVGNNRIADYQYQATVNVVQGYNFGDTMFPVSSFDAVNPDLRWETTSMFNIGADIGLLNNSLNLTAEYYVNDTYDILIAIPVPSLYGAGAPIQNAGKVQNKGWEFSARYLFNTGNVNHTVSANISDSRNEVIDIKGTEWISGFDVNTIVREGYPIHSYYAYRANGFFQNDEEVANGPHLSGVTPKPGDIRYIDKNGDGIIKEDDDRFILGNRFPRILYGLNYAANWKGLDFSMFWQGVGQRNVWMRGESVEAFHNNNEGPVFDFHLDRWTPLNPNATYPRLTIGAESANNATKSSFWIDNAAYLRLKNIQLGYTLPTIWSNKISLKSLRIYSSVQNAFTITQMKGGWDPEASDGSGRIYPVNRTFSMGLNVNF
ncbi:SusC/RagA family TonB-linked outer membrane protein [Sphingobacterium sp. SGL-16]|uniref:SusC/RagA family TonB-linked outer membrane protein n=1 Tax=Sphingobacterium sp. SGL-16 TaxID=2710883 RepID=UPI0013EDA7F0|nr:TonB-dependent receptor [Sphingobacterium sp. SGL-16]NGM73637.1 TonB-dependent receptor [Sphingobacterium sp. SGL-16]